MNRVYIIVVNWNGWRDTVECLDSLFFLTYSPFTVVVCDNGSHDDSVAQLKRWGEQRNIPCDEYRREDAESGGRKGAPSPLVLILNGANLGFAGGNNVGLRYALARGDFAYAWLLNNDTIVKDDSLTRLVERMERQPEAGLCGSTIRYYHNPGQVQALGGGYYCRWIGLPWHYGRFTRQGEQIDQARAEWWMNYVEGASTLVSRAFLEEIGLMSEEYFLYFEEADWAMRARGKFKLVYAPQSIVYHKVGASIGTSSNPARKSQLCDYFNIRNRLYFTLRYFPEALPTVYLGVICSLIVRMVLGRWDRAMMILRLMRGYSDLDPDFLPACRDRS
ncbi:glycosyltransferase family 2 protein [Geobacter argillaceus]|uniref:Glycosyltransferase 2-like domain-containing protein n=1 Tax=Geobacter argillaceus TaxID=345631 RepID=A0A562VNR5_9BACT|nr:glycosyltransferase family 2 protein [Geobacter argillaceus]TWJ19377.1 hypothetical protein JN12_01793 [Geobacter argillaceus]